jgi:hypothetical protein
MSALGGTIHNLLENLLSPHPDNDERYMLYADLAKEVAKNGHTFSPDVERRTALLVLHEVSVADI